MSDITSLLRAASAGDRASADRAFALLYEDLQRLARRRLRRRSPLTLLDTNALVHESYLRLQGRGAAGFPDHHHFMAYAAKVMRAVVIDAVGARQAERRGGGGVVRDGDDRCQNTPCRVLPGLGLQFQLWSGQRCEQRA